MFAGQTVGIREVADQIWLVSFMHYDLGFFDKDEGRIEPAPNPFAPVKGVNHVTGVHLGNLARPDGLEPPTGLLKPMY